VRTRRCSPITILTRTGQCVAAAALMAGLAFAAAPIAGADWDIEVYDACMATNGEKYAHACCDFSGGTWHSSARGSGNCQAALVQSAPPPPPTSQIVTPVAPGSKAPILPVSPGGQAPTVPVG
jgi:hypothetical protein